MTAHGGGGDAGARVRPAVDADRAQIGRIAEAAGLFPAEALGAMAAGDLGRARPDIWLVADDGARISGFAFCRPEPLTEGTWNLLAIAVDPRMQGHGRGAALLAAIESRLRADGARLLVIETSDAADQQTARAFYRARRYREAARIGDFWAPNVAKLVFTKSIADVA